MEIYTELNLNLKSEHDRPMIYKIAKGLASELRLQILDLLYSRSLSIPELSKALDIPPSSLEFHIAQLEESGLILIKYAPEKKGFVRILRGNPNNINIYFNDVAGNASPHTATYSVGVGMYCDINCDGERGMATVERGFRNAESDFHEQRDKAGIIWLSDGSVTYAFPNEFFKTHKASEVSVSLEICSETNGYRNDWKSDITFALNGVPLTVWTSPGDMGDKRGLLNPENLPRINTQYGFLKTVTVKKDGCYLDGALVNPDVTIDDLKLEKGNRVLFTLSNAPGCRYRGGMNIFGKTFGNTEQDIVFTAKE